MLVHNLITESATRYPERIFITNEHSPLTYTEFFNGVNAIANFLNNQRINKGDRVIISLDNRAEAFLLFFATVSVGAIAVPLSPTLTPVKLQYILDNCQPRFFCGGKSLNILRQTSIRGRLESVIALQETPRKGWPEFVRISNFQDALTLGGAPTPRHRIIDLDPAMIIYTSGSTGTPKGILCSHLNIMSATRSIATYLGLLSNDKIIDFQPPFFDYGLYQSFLTAFIGASLYLERNFMYPSEALNRIEKDSITVIPFLPTNMISLFSQQTSARQPLNSVRLVTNTGAPFPIHLIQSVKSLFPNAAIFSMYGLTECKRVSYLPPDQLDLKPNSVGIPMPNTEAWIVDEEDQRVGPGNIGELVVRGSNVTLGYWGDTEASAKTFRVRSDGERWLYTGDYFRSDDEGYLYFVGRNDDILKVGGYRTSTKEIEACLAHLDFVQEVAAVPIPDKLLGNTSKVFIVLKRGCTLTERQIRQFCQHAFESSTLVPKLIEIVPELPRTQSGKIDYRSLVGVVSSSF